jgi:hypothetical protein
MFIDLDTGELGTPPEDLPNTDAEAVERWVREQGADAVGETSEDVRGLVGFGIVAIPVRNHQWGRVMASIRDNERLDLRRAPRCP